jgi:hypothetical protein
MINNNTTMITTGVTHEIKFLGKQPDKPKTDIWLVKLMYRNETKWFVERVEAPSKLDNIETERLLSWLFHSVSCVTPYETFQEFKGNLHPHYGLDRARNFYNSCKTVEINLQDLLKEDFHKIAKIVDDWNG